MSRIYQAPGRVNLIGEFTDFNDGFVMPAALGFSTRIEAARRADRMLSMRSGNSGEAQAFSLDDPDARACGQWSDYVRGVAVMLERAGFRLSGADLTIQGNVPMGAGLSSSASLEVAAAKALLGVSGLAADPTQIAKLCQSAENQFVGIQCGIMDQFVACHGAPGRALLLDCRSLEFQWVELPAEARIVICNTMVRHELASSEYNRRREECMQGVRRLAQFVPGVSALRDVTPADLEAHKAGMRESVYRRCRHVIRENARVLEGYEALGRGDPARFGELMLASHESLRADFEVSCEELDLLVRIANRAPGIYGSRMTGGGFGGCTVNLVRREQAGEFGEAVKREYRKATGIEAEIY